MKHFSLTKSLFLIPIIASTGCGNFMEALLGSPGASMSGNAIHCTADCEVGTDEVTPSYGYTKDGFAYEWVGGTECKGDADVEDMKADAIAECDDLIPEDYEPVQGDLSVFCFGTDDNC